MKELPHGKIQNGGSSTKVSKSLGKIFFFFTAISDILNVLYVFQKWISCCSSCISDSCACRDTFELLDQHFYLFSVLMLQNVGVF